MNLCYFEQNYFSDQTMRKCAVVRSNGAFNVMLTLPYLTETSYDMRGEVIAYPVCALVHLIQYCSIIYYILGFNPRH